MKKPVIFWHIHVQILMRSLFVLVLYIALVTKTGFKRAYTAGTYVQHEAVCRDLKILLLSTGKTGHRQL